MLCCRTNAAFESTVTIGLTSGTGKVCVDPVPFSVHSRRDSGTVKLEALRFRTPNPDASLEKIDSHMQELLAEGGWDLARPSIEFLVRYAFLSQISHRCHCVSFFTGFCS